MSDDPTTRREWLGAVGRYMVLGGLGAGALRLATRGTAEADASCARQFTCARCGAVTDCQLPQGIRARRALHSAPPGDAELTMRRNVHAG